VRVKVLTWMLGMTTCVAGGSATWAISHTQVPSFKIGDRSPAMEPIEWLQGNPVAKFEPGRVYVVEFWATWCPPCITTIPHLTAVQKKYTNTVTVVSVNADGLLGFEGKVDTVHDFMKKHGKETMTKAWITASGSLGAPVAFIIDQRGKLAWVGYPDLVQSYSFDQALEDTLAGKPDLLRARTLQVATSHESDKLLKAGQKP
jgi:thiol-disulfide isomerase/thioredoxin